MSYDFKVSRSGTRKPIEVIDDETRERKNESRKRSMLRARSRFRRILHTNAGKWQQAKGLYYPPAFITFTFKENLSDPKSANKIFTLFIKRLNFNIHKSKKSVLKYITVTEFQKRGAVHYHCIFFNLPAGLVEHERMTRRIAAVWERGFIDVKNEFNVEGMVRYLTKYMVKSFDDPRLDGKKRYFGSRELLLPIEIKDQKLARKILGKLSDTNKVYERVFESEYQGITMYQKFKIPPDHYIHLNAESIRASMR
jgi:hypothetical protein